ncbi:hypothetical protein B0A48_10108 [Cryoendolithus antarcticus]|uniref:Low temperature viability protein n=1 Tax=Cryoendolithus antarcticus TaxID=1507870 RepID=A0A1V8SWL0_9PEZI|nr:hypothetical protein B0A48_10108 [Cryoendolithus antarcticus]
MPRRKAFDKKTATTFALVHRAQNDPLINDDEAPSMVFAEKQTRHVPDEDFNALPSSSSASAFSSTSTRSRKVKQRGDLEDEFGVAFRPYEGQAAEHGVFFDDTQYDYMQHMRDLGTGQGPVTWVPAAQPKEKGKGKQKLEDALRDMEICGGDDLQSVGQSSMASSVARSLLPEEVLPSEFVMRRSYQDQQDVPDEIAGFQPDMDPRLREALEALEDEEYVDDEDDDLFGELTKEGREVEIDEWERLGEQQMFTEGEAELDDGWESDITVTAKDTSKREPLPTPGLDNDEIPTAPTDVQAEPPADPTSGAWFDEFKKFKSAAKEDAGKTPNAPPSALASSALFSTATGRTKKRKGAKTSTTNYSMSSSALLRTDQQTLLDSRFDKVERMYALDELGDEDDDDMPLNDTTSLASGMTGGTNASRMSRYSTKSGMSGVSGISSYSRATDSEAPMLERSDFSSIMDEFLGGHSKQGKTGKRVKKSGFQTGMEQLDEVRRQLGPARFGAKVNVGSAG